MLRYAARLTLTGTVTWLPAGNTNLSSSIDPGAAGSTIDASIGDTTSASITGSGMRATGSPSASIYLALLAASSDGVNLTPAADAGREEVTTTGHPFFSPIDMPPGSTWVQAVVTLGATPPTITNGNGFVWTQLAQHQFGSGWLTVWSAPITRQTSAIVADEEVTLSQTCDSGIGFGLAGQAP